MRPLIKCHGGKFYLKKWIISHFPPVYVNRQYFEPYIGGGSVLLNKLPSYIETINDLNPELYDIWYNIINNGQLLLDELANLQYCQHTFNKALNTPGATWASLVKYRFSRGGLGKAFAWSERLRGGRPGDSNAWMTFVTSELPRIVKRCRSVLLYNKPALEIIQNNNLPGVFFYLDPPYLHETRKAKKAYVFEMTDLDHKELLDTLRFHKAQIMISGYRSTLYDTMLAGWTRFEKNIVNHASQQTTKPMKVECIWTNY